MIRLNAEGNKHTKLVSKYNCTKTRKKLCIAPVCSQFYSNEDRFSNSTFNNFSLLWCLCNFHCISTMVDNGTCSPQEKLSFGRNEETSKKCARASTQSIVIDTTITRVQIFRLRFGQLFGAHPAASADRLSAKVTLHHRSVINLRREKRFSPIR